MDPRNPVRVAAAVIRRQERYLLTRRDAGRELAGFWEFPGGKIEPGETPHAALARELREELGVEIGPATALAELSHDYPGKTVALTFLETKIESGEPRALDVAAFGWFDPGEMSGLPILPADLPVVDLLERRRHEAPGKERDDA